MADKKVFKFEAKNLPIGQLEINKGQLYGLPKNPRFIKDARYEALKKSIEDAPEMLNLRELLVYPLESGNYIIIGGNMRFRACQELGFTELPCKLIPLETPVEKLREYTIKDNEGFGQNDWDILANEWAVEELQQWGMECSFLGQEGQETNLDDFFEEVKEEQKDNKEKEIVVSVCIPEEEADLEATVRDLITKALEEYPNISIK